MPQNEEIDDIAPVGTWKPGSSLKNPWCEFRLKGQNKLESHVHRPWGYQQTLSGRTEFACSGFFLSQTIDGAHICTRSSPTQLLWKHPKGPTELSADSLRRLLILDPIELSIVVNCHTWPVRTLHSSRLQYCLWDWSKNDGAEFHKRKKHTWSPSLPSTDLPWSLSLWIFIYGSSH